MSAHVYELRHVVSSIFLEKFQEGAASGVLVLLFFHEISFYASFEAYSYIFTAQTMGLL